MTEQKIDTRGLNEALSKYGSLQEAVLSLEATKHSLEDEMAKLAEKKAAYEKEVAKLKAAVKSLGTQVAQQREALQQLQARVEQSQRQWDLFEGFVSMVLTSPSANAHLHDLMVSLLGLEKDNWYTTRTAEELRALFVRQVLGSYLRCYRCRSCGAHFIVNREPYYKYYDPTYHCPACHTSLHVEADNSFLEAMMSPEEVAEARTVEELQRELARLEPLKVFLDIPCFICGKPLSNTWSREQVVDTFKKSRWAHRPCWGTPAGQVAQMADLIKGLRYF